MDTFRKIYHLKFVLEWAERIVAVSIGRVVVAIASVVVAVVVIASSIYAWIVGIAIGFDLSLILNLIFFIKNDFLYKIIFLIDYLHLHILYIPYVLSNIFLLLYLLNFPVLFHFLNILFFS